LRFPFVGLSSCGTCFALCDAARSFSLTPVVAAGRRGMMEMLRSAGTAGFASALRGVGALSEGDDGGDLAAEAAGFARVLGSGTGLPRRCRGIKDLAGALGACGFARGRRGVGADLPTFADCPPSDRSA
jgi:hypothetical protein